MVHGESSGRIYDAVGLNVERNFIVSFELYEIWAEDDTGHQELIDTTKSLSHAMQLAEKTLSDDVWIIVTVYQETEDGDLKLIKEFT
jgi:hypothetical protein